MNTGTYHLKEFTFNNGFVSHYIRVEVIGESNKSYQVKYLQPGLNGQGVGTVKWVRKHNIKMDFSYANNIRLPYKN